MELLKETPLKSETASGDDRSTRSVSPFVMARWEGVSVLDFMSDGFFMDALKVADGFRKFPVSSVMSMSEPSGMERLLLVQALVPLSKSFARKMSLSEKAPVGIMSFQILMLFICAMAMLLRFSILIDPKGFCFVLKYLNVRSSLFDMLTDME